LKPVEEKISLPSQNRNIRAWEYLAMTCLIVFYIAQIIMKIAVSGPNFISLGSDFLGFWSSGFIANHYGYSNIYDLGLMEQVQKHMVQQLSAVTNFWVVPVPYLPIFIILFQVFALFPVVPAFAIWSILNLVGFFFYVSFFLHKMGVNDRKRLSLIGLLAFSTFVNTFWGQVNLLPLIFVGEFIRNINKKHDLLSGMWLGGLILKPQLLILIGPFLLFQKKWKALGGLCITMLITVFVSILLGGVSSIFNWMTMMFTYIPGIATNAPEFMMNWRMVGVRLSYSFPSYTAWGIAAVGMIGTVVVTYFLWRKPLLNHSQNFLIAFFGTLAATLAFTWHSHIHMAITLIPLLLYFYNEKILPEKLFNWWIFGIPFIILGLLLPINLLHLDQYKLLSGTAALSFLIFNMVFLFWALKSLGSRRPDS
jgi:hypothetical protein